uniref:Leucine-rich repeats and calponin homology (CH) domain containing 4 n=1 Tax=Tetraodon nigroviridis TaxID=99883 RepID=H3CBZ3_TETNG
SRSVEKALEEAALSGALNLANRLKEFPRSARNYDLSDITHAADLSRNRLCELPQELSHFLSLESLSLYHNGMRSLSPGLSNLQALTYLNLSRNLLSSLPPAVFQLPFLRVLIISNNKLCSLSASIYALSHLRQLDVSCNELQSLPAELGQLERLRDLNLRRNQLTSLPEEISELPLVRLDASCNGISRVPLCYRRLRQLQSLSLDNNPLQMPPAHVCSRGKYHIFKYLNMEACRRSQEELQHHLRPSWWGPVTEQELFPGQMAGLDSGFSSVESGSKRWSGNESTDDVSERSLHMSEAVRDPSSPGAELEEREEEPLSPTAQTGFLPFVEEQLRGDNRPRFYVEERPPSSPKDAGPSSPSSPGAEQRRRPDTLLLWRERECQVFQQSGNSGCSEGRKRLTQNAEQTGAGSPSPRTSPSKPGSLRAHTYSLRRSVWGATPTLTPPPFPPAPPQASSSQRLASSSQAPKPSSFLFRTSSHSNVRPTGSESCVALRSPREERPELAQLRQTLESQLKISLPEDLGQALSNGTVLCQLANHVRPRSVSIIHVPSPAVPRLSPAKCRLNVENFLSACRKLGVPETAVCSSSDVLVSNLSPVLDCVAALLALRSSPSSPPALLSFDFLLFYCAAMALLCVLYRHLLA